MSAANFDLGWVTCSCCGAGIRDEDNISHGEEPYPHDHGFGMCRECGGDDREEAPPVKSGPGKGWPTEAAYRKRLGWAGEMFYDARIKLLRESMSEENLAKFEAVPYAKKCVIIGKMIEKGMMI